MNARTTQDWAKEFCSGVKLPFKSAIHLNARGLTSQKSALNLTQYLGDKTVVIATSYGTRGCEQKQPCDYV